MRGKVFLACVLGGGTGALVALQLWQPLWWVGLIVGGLTGYIAYDFRAVARAIPPARAMVADPPRWRSAAATALCCAFVGTIFTVPLLVLSAYLQFVGAYNGAAATLEFAATPLFVAAGLSALEFFLFDQTHPFGTEISKFNVFSVYCYYLPRGIWWVIKRVPGAIVATIYGLARSAVATVRFVKYLFILIHSEMRLLCALDAAFGAAIGYFAGSAAIGALAGGVIGVVNFEIVSKRLLHLVPSR